MTATFMPKPFRDRTGTGLHLHVSLWDGETPLFPAANQTDGLGLSPLALSFIAGVLDHSAGLQAVLAPTVNSYKRTGALSTSSGASWAPRAPTYGGNDRTHYIRVPDPQRIELRGPDGSANPYLAIAAILGAGLAGIAAASVPSNQDRPTLPPTLFHAVEAFEADSIVRAALDSGDRDVSQYFAALKRDEFFAWHGEVSPWEIDQYLTAF
jgi:glutamine synthetase